jgi:hypothetical protein
MPGYKINVADRFTFEMMDTSGVYQAGKTPNVAVSKDGAAFASATGNTAEIANGAYIFVGNTASDWNATALCFKASAANCRDTFIHIRTEQDVTSAGKFPATLGAGDVANNAISSGSFATDVLSANAVSAGAVSKIAAGISVTGGNSTVRYIVEVGTGLPAETLYLNTGLTGPALRYTLKDAAFRGIPYGANDTVRFIMTPYANTTPSINTTSGITLTDPAGGVVTFDWATAGVVIPAAGDYKIQWQVNATIFPIGGYILTKVA